MIFQENKTCVKSIASAKENGRATNFNLKLDTEKFLKIISIDMSYGTVNRQPSTVNRNSGIRQKVFQKAFTLVEIIFVIAIIGVLVSILLPGFSKMKREATKLQDASNLKKIAEAWKSYSEKFGPVPVHTDNGLEFFHYLSGGSIGKGWQGEDHCFINDLSVYLSNGDAYCSELKKGRAAISSKGGISFNAGLDCISNLKNDITTHNGSASVSYSTISGLYAGVPPTTTPIGFTRGLMSNGKWHSKYGLYGSEGGYVVFADGHVKWFDGKRAARFLKWDQSGYTNDIREAVPNNTFISSGYAMRNDVREDNALLIIYHSGTGGAE